eukprot:gnl/TRDRNA2_/TRDRNA2_127501_c2_seq1.p1 gnl/TRDRNA2_/TRDRNA2_127501_c2~~gnl/TRDRNA2_/TRDRNA2_127501_c2_seq1.p1  ORF type:complete len:396 (-),score=39.27 gnl/TRDRNA2_/TRDRNA2_127501_c2_seq1:30-1118(-)
MACEVLKRSYFISAFAFAAAAVILLAPEAGAAVAKGATLPTPTVDMGVILRNAAKKAFGGGIAGAFAAVLSTLSTMWLHTAVCYQYRYGGGFRSALKKLYKEGGICRLYRGLPFALVHVPLIRFGNAASYVGVMSFLGSMAETAGLPLPVKTALASIAAGLWRILCMPVDTTKVALQVEGRPGLKRLKMRVLNYGLAPLYQGTLASALASVAANFPWFLVYKFLDDIVPHVDKDASFLLSVLRSALLGLSASCASDAVANSLRVIKTTQQTAYLNGTSRYLNSRTELSVPEALKLVLDKDGILGLLTRGLKTKLLTNAIQGAMFTVWWNYLLTRGLKTKLLTNAIQGAMFTVWWNYLLPSIP